MKTYHWLLGCGLLTALPIVAQTIVRETHVSGIGSNSNLTRERDALYLEDVLKKPIRLKVKSDAVVYNNLVAERRLGVIPSGTVVNVIAVNERALRVRGKAEHADVSGWVGKAFLEALDPRVTENLTKMLERQKLVEELIQKKIVALGMTSAEVERVLGPPSKRTSRVDKGGQYEVYDYIAYKLVPQQVAQRDQTGQIFYTLVSTKVEIGRRSVTFENHIVSAIEESEQKGGRSSVVPVPIEIDLLSQ